MLSCAVADEDYFHKATNNMALVIVYNFFGVELNLAKNLYIKELTIVKLGTILFINLNLNQKSHIISNFLYSLYKRDRFKYGI